MNRRTGQLDQPSFYMPQQPGNLQYQSDAVELAELWHYNVLDTFGDRLPWGGYHSIGIAQLRVDTVRDHGIYPGLTEEEIKDRLLDPVGAIETLALDIRYIANLKGVNLANWDSKSEAEKEALAAKFTTAKDIIDLEREFGTITPFGEHFGVEAYRTVRSRRLLD